MLPSRDRLVGLVLMGAGAGPMGQAKDRWDIFISAVSDWLRADPIKGGRENKRYFQSSIICDDMFNVWCA